MKFTNYFIALVLCTAISGCTLGSLVSEPKDYEVFPMGENQYLLRTSVGIFENGLKSSWHKKAKEICKSDEYQGVPKIYSNYGATHFGPGLPLRGSQSKHKVAAGPLKCVVNAKL
jgi:hypothetical protein